MKFSVACPQCRQRLAVDSSLSGQTIGCPKCRSKFSCPGDPDRETQVASAPPGASSPAKQRIWYVRVAGQCAGPMALGQLREMAARGALTPFDYVRSAEQSEWQEAGSLQIFEKTSGAPQQSPPTTIHPNPPPSARHDVPPSRSDVPPSRSDAPPSRSDVPHRFLENLKSISPLAWRLGTVVVVVMVAIAVALIGGWSSEGDSGDGHRARVVEPSPEKPSKIAEKPDTTVTTPPSMADIAKLIDPSVVTIVVEGRGQGSGFVVDANGTIVTNYHVIEGAKKATVIFRDGTKADVLGFSAFSAGKDLTVIHVAPAGRTLRPLELADEQPNKGTTVLAFGSPRGLTSSVSDGIVSAVRLGSELRQMLTTDLYVNLGFDFDATWIQTTAPISHGNSGGPLVDQAGKVVGVNTWSPGGQNLNFAISAAHVKRLMAQRSNRIRPLSELPEPRKAKEAEVASDGSFKGHSDEVLSVAFSPDGLKVLSGSVDETMRLWDTATGKEIRRFKALSGQVSSVAFSPNGLKVLSGSGEGTMWLWDTATGKEICSFEGHSGQVLSVAFSPDGLKVLSGGWDRTMRLWDTATGREIRGFKGHSGKVSSVAFSPNGLKVLLGSADGTLRLWNSMLSMKE